MPVSKPARSLLHAILAISLLSSASCGGGGSGGSSSGSAPSPPAADTRPDAFSFASVDAANRNALVVSETIDITGIDAATDVSVTGGEYSIDGGAFTGIAGMATNGQTIAVRLNASPNFSTEVAGTVTIGGVSGSFRVTTVPEPKVLIDVNANVRHSVGGVDTLDRSKFITLHADVTDQDWFGNDVHSRFEPNALANLMQDVLENKDVYTGRSTGGITFWLGEMREDPNRPGFVDEVDATDTGAAIRSNYSNSMESRWVTSRQHADREVNLIVGAQQHPFWPDGTATRQGWALSQNDTPTERFGTASGHWMGQYLSKFYTAIGSVDDGAARPALVEVMNEPVYDLHDFPPLKQPPEPAEPLQKIFAYHNAVAAAIRDTNSDVLIGGYTAAFPNFEENDFDRWRSRHKAFLDLAGNNMDFTSIHLYDFAAIDRGNGVFSEYRKGNNVEATFDMLDHYSTLLHGAPKPLVISEYGGRAHIMENAPWSPERDWVMLKSVNSLLMAFLERQDNLLMTVPFVVLKAEWGRTNVPYPWRLMRQRFEAAGETGNEWVYTELVKFYDLWSGVDGTRVDSHSTDPDVLVDAYVDGADLFVILNNLEFEDTAFNLQVAGLAGSNVSDIQQRHLYADADIPVLDVATPAELPESIELGGESTMILRLRMDAAPTINETAIETKHYATEMLQPIAANASLSFDIDGLTPGLNGEATLRLGVGRAHGLSLVPTVSVNGTDVAVPTDYRGYDQFNNGRGRAEFFGVLEIPLPWTVIQPDNQVDVTFADGGGHISSIALQVFEQSLPITRRTR